MPLLTAATQTQQPDYIALAMVVALLIFVAVAALRKRFVSKKTPEVAQPEPAPQEQEVQPSPEAPGSAGQLKIHSVEPKTAAMLMAIVADQVGKPLNELRFISIKEVTKK